MKLLSALILCLMMVLSLGSQARASSSLNSNELSGDLALRWRTKVIKLSLSRSFLGDVHNIKFGTDVRAALDNSLRTWELATGFRFEILESERLNVSPSGVAGDGVSLITIAPTTENIQFFGRQVLEMPAATRIFYDRNGRITEGDVVLSPLHQFSSDGTFGTFDLESVFTHELGHLLGIGHSDIPGAVMSEELAANGIFGRPNFNGRTLTLLDLALVRSAYPDTVVVDDCCAAIAGTVSSSDPDRSLAGFVWAEDPSTNVIVGSTAVSTKGTYSISGLKGGEYILFYSRKDDGYQRYIGNVTLAAGKKVSHKSDIQTSNRSISLVAAGANGDLAKSSVAANPGQTISLSVAGTNIRLDDIYLGLTSSYFTVVPSSFSSRTTQSGLIVVTFDVIVDSEAEFGSYSIIAETHDGERAYLPGAVSIVPSMLNFAQKQ